MEQNNPKSSRSILLLKEQYKVPDDDPIFLFLEGYADLQDKMSKSIGAVNELEKITFLRAEELLKSTDILDGLSEKIYKQNKELPSFVNEELQKEITYVSKEINKFGTQIKSMVKDIKHGHNKHMSRIDMLANNANMFSRTMDKMQKNHLNSKYVYAFLSLVVLLQITSFFVKG